MKTDKPGCTRSLGDDTICALATPTGNGGVGVVRVSGPAALAVAGRLLDKEESAFEDRRMIFGVARSPVAGTRLDDVLVVAMRTPRSYTGEDVVEVHGHGGAVNMQRLLQATLDAGARLAEPGEFTRRAFANGRMDLTQVEAVAQVIGASSERSLRMAQSQLAGQLGQRVDALRARAVALVAELEAAVEFPDERLQAMEKQEVGMLALVLAQELVALAESHRVGRAVSEGVSVALVGAANVGKSSLLNALVGRERAVVTSEAGTTRDFLEARVVWSGVMVTMVDTAGLREAHGEAELRGLQLSAQRAAQADLRLRIIDATATFASCKTDPGRELVVYNKTDLKAAPVGQLGVSALTGAGLSELKQAVVRTLLGSVDESDDDVVSSERQRRLFVAAAEALKRASSGAKDGRSEELLACDVRLAAKELGRITGEDVDEAVLDDLFARFCIGK